MNQNLEIFLEYLPTCEVLGLLSKAEILVRKNKKNGNLYESYLNNDLHNLISIQENTYNLLIKRNLSQTHDLGAHLTYTADSYSLLANFENSQENIDKCLEKRLEALSYFDGTLKNASISNVEEIGEIYFNFGNYDKAIKYYNKAAFLARLKDKKKPHENNPSAWAIYKKIYNNFLKINDLETSAKFRLKALHEIKRKKGNEVSTAFAYLNIGSITKDINNYERALFYYYKAKDHLEKAKEQEEYNTYKFPETFLENRIIVLEKLKVK